MTTPTPLPKWVEGKKNEFEALFTQQNSVFFAAGFASGARLVFERLEKTREKDDCFANYSEDYDRGRESVRKEVLDG